MAASAMVMASTLRRTRVSPGTAVWEFIVERTEGARRIGAAGDRVNVKFPDMTDSRPRVLVTDREYRKGEDSFTAAPGLECIRAPEAEEELAAAVREAHARHVIVGMHGYSGALYDALRPGGVIARFGVGHDSVDKTRATKAGLFCTNTPGVLNQSVAEHTLLLIGAAARALTAAAASMAQRAWSPVTGVELHAKTLAIVGCGAIGQAVARIAALGYGMDVVGCSRQDAPPPAALEHFRLITNDFAAAVRDADFVSLHMPATSANVRFINRERLTCFRQKAWLINTARGSVVDEAALFEALSDGRLAGAALDVFEREPYVPAAGNGDLRSLPNVILTPHVGSNTFESNRRVAERALRNIMLAEARDFARMDLLNPEVLS
jgi:phosphoglycerate dehydrogenase-like enzyme